MSDAAAVIFFLVGALGTAVAFVILFAKRYPRRSGWLGLGIVLGIAAMFLWPITGLIGAMSEQVVEPGRAVAAEPDTVAPAPDSGAAASSPVLTVVDVIDGDTIKLSDGRIIQLIGIDAPETVASGPVGECWGPEAATFTRQTLLDKSVTLVDDPTQGLVDGNGGTLAYVVLRDGRDFSVLAAEAGHVRVHRGNPPAQRYDAIAAAESRARAAGLGLWGPACVSPQPGAPLAAGSPPVVSPSAAPRPVLSPPAAPRPAAERPAAPPAQAPQTVIPPPSQSNPAPEPGPAPEPDPAPPSGPASEPDPVYYRNCSEARAAGAAPLHAGEPGYRSGLDQDGDGIACES